MTIFCTIPHFFPAYKAGGPTQSMINMVEAMAQENVQLYILCSNTDLDGAELNVESDKWVVYSTNTKVYYATAAQLNKQTINSLLNEVKPEVLFINGIYSWPFTMVPLLWEGSARRIVAVRGMLHPGALSQKSLKKRLYLAFYKWKGLHTKYEFHATSDEERDFIFDVMGKKSKVFVVPNLPRVIYVQPMVEKQQGILKMLSVALISPMKNIKLVLEALKNCSSNITYDIYGPVKDAAYHEECMEAIQLLPKNITANYMGPLPTEEVAAVMAEYECFILPSKSENFGHAIYEALSAGKPVITSEYTPWKDLMGKRAGINVDINDTSSITKAIEKMADLDNAQYAFWSKGAVTVAMNSIDKKKIIAGYKKLFGIHTNAA